MSLCASAQTFDFSADIHTHEYDGLTIYLIKNDVVWRDRAIRIDSCKIVGGKYHFSLPAPDSAFVATVALPPKNKNFMYGLPEIQCIVEDGKVNADCRGFALTLKGGKLNQSYDDDFLTHNRMLRQKVDSMMSRRDSIEKHRQLTDAEDGAYTTQIKAMYDGLKPFLCRFIACNITNDVGAYMFLSYSDDYFDPSFVADMRSKVSHVYLREKEEREAAQRKAIETAERNHRLTTVGNHYRDFESKTIDGKAVRLSDYVKHGHVTLLDFWASWCGPCLMEAQELKKLYTSYHAKGFDIVSLSLDTSRDNWLSAIKKHQLTWQHISSLKGFKDPGALQYAVSAIPYVVLIDRNGNIVLQNIHGKQLHQKIRQVMGEK